MTIILDPAFGDRAPSNVGNAFWIVESPSNRALAETLFSASDCDPNSAVFKANPAASRLEEVLSLLPDVMLHHPDWTELAFVGLELDDQVRRALREEGLSVSQRGAEVIAKRA